MNWLWPLPGTPKQLPSGDGSFGFVRKHEIHTGVDLYCTEGQEVRAVASGFVIDVVDFTGSKAGSPWWNATRAVLVWGDDGVVVYGELQEDSELVAGRKVAQGQRLGAVRRVRLEDNDKPTTMLHLELWRPVTAILRHYEGSAATDPNDWKLGEEKPEGLIDPTPFLVDSTE